MHNKKLAEVPESVKQQMDAKPPMTDDEKKERKAMFDTADANKDGLLDKAEFFTFSTALSDQAKGRYGPEAPSYTEEESEIVFNAVNSLNPDNDGIAMMDLMRFGITMKKINANLV